MLSSVEFNLLRKSLVMWQINSSSGGQRVGGVQLYLCRFLILLYHHVPFSVFHVTSTDLPSTEGFICTTQGSSCQLP